MKYITGIPESTKKRVVIIGGGFAGLQLAKSLRKSEFQIVLLDKNNYHQFQPLFYQVATAGLEPSAITFPLRKALQNQKNIHFRIASLEKVEPETNQIKTDLGMLNYDYLVLAIGADTNYFNNENIRQHATPMKSLSEAINLRNVMLSNFEKALNETEQSKIDSLLNFVIVGGGPTGTELAGALAEMKKHILPKDYPELDFSKMKIILLEASDKILNGYSDNSSKKGEKYLDKLGVEVHTNTFVQNYDGKKVELASGDTLATDTLIWAAGVKGNLVNGLGPDMMDKGGRLKVNRFNQVGNQEGDLNNVYAIGDLALMKTEKFEHGHPQVAQVAIQQASLLSKNLQSKEKGKALKPFKYSDKGSLATIGRNLAVADLPFISFAGFTAWILWLFVHLMAILGVKNRLFVFINWVWSYFTYDQSLRLLINPNLKSKKSELMDKSTPQTNLHPQ